MTAGTDFIEDYDSYRFPDSDIQVIDYERQASFRPLNGKSPIGVLSHFRTYGLAREHGAWFDYRSPLTNIVARVLECATGLDYASLLSRDLWGQIGAEHPAEIVVDHLGFPVAEAGISCSLRDLARVGLVYVNNGSIGDVQVVPEGWARDCFTIDAVAHGAFSASPSKVGHNSAAWHPHAYRNAWWVVDSERVATALGIFGQFCWIHRPSRTVVARFSSWTNPSSDDALDASLRAFDAIVRAL
jgi:CubicO group peptidase (beta-lactamase class C family)